MVFVIFMGMIYRYFVGNGFVRYKINMQRFFKRYVIFKIHEKVYLDNLWDMDLVLCMENIYGKYVWVLCER